MSKKNKNINCPTACESPDLQAANENAALQNSNYRQSEGKNGCEGCALFDISSRMKKCVDDNSGNVGYCWSNYFKCKAGMTCDAFEEGGPLTSDNASEELQNRFKEEALSNQPIPVNAQGAESQMTEQMMQNPQIQQQPIQGPPPEGMMPPQAMIPQQGMQPPMFQEGGEEESDDRFTPEEEELMLNYWERLDTNEDGLYNEQDSVYFNPYYDAVYDFRSDAPKNEEGDFIDQNMFDYDADGNITMNPEMYDNYAHYILPHLDEENRYSSIYDSSGQLIMPQRDADGNIFLPGYDITDDVRTEDIYSDANRDIPQEIIDQVGGKAFDAWLVGLGSQQLVNPTAKVVNKVSEKVIKNKIIKEGTKQGIKTALKLGTKTAGAVAWPLELVDFGYQVAKGTPENYWLWKDIVKPASNFAWEKWGDLLEWGNDQLRKDDEFREVQDNLNSSDPEKKKDGLNQLYQGLGGYSIPTQYWQQGGEQLPYVTREYDTLEDYHTAKSQRKGNSLGVSPLAGVGDTNITDVFGPLLDTNKKRKTHTLYNPTDETMFYDKTNPNRLYNEEEWEQYKTEQHSDNFVDLLNQRHEQMPDKYQKVTGYDPITKEITYAGDKLEGDLLNEGWQDQVSSGVDQPDVYHGWTQTEDSVTDGSYTGFDKGTNILTEDETGQYTFGEGDDQQKFKKTTYPTEAYGGDIRHFFPEFELGSEKLDEYGVERKPPSPSSQMDVLKPITHYQDGGDSKDDEIDAFLKRKIEDAQIKSRGSIDQRFPVIFDHFSDSLRTQRYIDLERESRAANDSLMNENMIRANEIVNPALREEMINRIQSGEFPNYRSKFVNPPVEGAHLVEFPDGTTNLNPSPKYKEVADQYRYQTGGITYDHEINPYTTYDADGNIIGTDNPYLSEESMDTRNYTKDEYNRSENTGGTGWGYGNPGQNLDYIPQSACPCDDGTMSVDCCKEEPAAEEPCPPCNGVVPERNANGDCPPCDENNNEQPCPCPDGTESVDCCDETDLGDRDDSAPGGGSNFDLGATAVGFVDALRPINRMLAARKEKKRRSDLKRNQLADNQFTVAANQDSKGDYDVNTGQLKQNKRIRSRQGRYGAELSKFLFGSEYQDGGFTFDPSQFTDTSFVSDTNTRTNFEVPDMKFKNSGKEYISGQSYPELVNQYNPKGIYTDTSYNQGTIDIPNNQKQIDAMARTNPVGSLFVGGKAIYDQFTKKEESKYGGDILDLDEQTIKELIAAGADIEIL
jgi:hypothetical protein